MKIPVKDMRSFLTWYDIDIDCFLLLDLSQDRVDSGPWGI